MSSCSESIVYMDQYSIGRPSWPNSAADQSKTRLGKASVTTLYASTHGLNNGCKTWEVVQMGFQASDTISGLNVLFLRTMHLW